MKYRKKPVTIEAYRTDVEMDIPTLEGTMHASVGDYIITGVRGEQYPCKPDIFLETYEPAQDGDSVVSGFQWHLMADEAPEYGTKDFVVMGMRGAMYLASKFIAGEFSEYAYFYIPHRTARTRRQCSRSTPPSSVWQVTSDGCMEQEGRAMREWLFIFIFLVTLAVMDILNRREERDPIVSTLIIMILFAAAFGVYSYVPGA
jgi:hypothetical protein